MHNFILKLFGFLKSCMQFIKVLLMFLIVLLMLYWMQDLTNSSWGWFAFANPIFEFLLDIGKGFTADSITIFSTVFEYKYLVVIVLIGATYFVVHLLYNLLNVLEDLYDSSRRFCKKMEENALNHSLEMEQKKEQKKLKTYRIYLQTFVKSAFAHREYNINLEEQNRILLKHLLEKTNTCPQKYQEGFLFMFYSFEKIDGVLEVFLKLMESKAPIDFLICVQVIGQETYTENEELKSLIGLKFLNKVTMLASTAYRYQFNENQRFETSHLGLFQKGSNTFEVHEFINKV